MLFAGIQKLTLLDYPEHTACTLFTQGCTFRCPFCHNASLIPLDRLPEDPMPEEEILKFLQHRKGILDGVCLTGGEPLMQGELPAFIRKVREMGFGVKLDTNGSQPDKLKALIDEGLLNMVAMDVKNSPERYAMTVGYPHFDLTPVQKSIDILMENRVDFEFRTTVSQELHRAEDIEKIGQWIQGGEKYFLQAYRDGDNVLHRGLHAPDEETMHAFRDIARKYLPGARVRGDSDAS